MKARLLMPSRYVAPLLVLALYACGEAPLSVGEIVERWEGPNPFGPRLVGGFEPSRCAPVPSPGGLGMRCEGRVSPAPDLLRLAERRRPLGPGSDASASPSAGDYRAEALWRLLLRPDGHVDALALLEEASAAFPRDPHVQSDLAALRLVRADLTGEMVDLVRALEHALAATEAGAPPPEAVFNLALALEALGLSERAEGVWERAAAIETDVTWREEITRRLRRAREVRSTPAPGPPPPEATPDRWRAFAL